MSSFVAARWARLGSFHAARVLGGALVIVALGCSDLSSPAPSGGGPTMPTPERFHVSSGMIRDAQGRAILLRGANVAGANKNAPYFGFQQLSDLQRMHDQWGMNSMRWVMTWAALEPSMGVYDDSYLDQLQQRLDWAYQAGIWVILDMHEDVYGEGFGFDGAPRWTCDASHYAAFKPAAIWSLSNLDPNVVACVDGFYSSPTLQAHFLEAWRRVAARFANHPAVLGFDPLNEPFWGSQAPSVFEAGTLETFYESVTSTVRGQAPHWLAFIEPCSSRNLGIPTALTPFPFGDVVYSPHSYDVGAESGMGFNLSGVQSIAENGASLRMEADMLGAALWVGEFGGVSTLPTLAQYMEAEVDSFEAHNAGSSYWSYDEGGGYSLLNADGSERSTLFGVLIRPYAERIAGTPLQSSYDPTTQVYTLTWTPDATSTVPTLIRLAPRLYPKGYQASCGMNACTITTTDTGLSVSTSASGSVTLTLTPSP